MTIKMTEIGEVAGYGSASAVESAIREAARRAALSNPSKTVSEYIGLAYLDRLICRIFSVCGESQWILKGGNGMLARIADARYTTDVDFYTGTLDVEAAKEEVIKLASIDLADYFSFRFNRDEQIINGDEQSNVEGLRLKFDAYLGASLKRTINIDVAIGKAAPNKVETISPIVRLDLPKLVTFDYRVWPIENQIADKVCATLQQYKSGRSTRSKDLFDLLAIAQTQRVSSANFSQALSTEASGRGIQLGEEFDFPKEWWALISKNHKGSLYLKPFTDVDEVAVFLNQFIFGHASGHDEVWNPKELTWQTPSS